VRVLVSWQKSPKSLKATMVKVHAMLLACGVLLGPSAMVALVNSHAFMLAILVMLGPSATVALVSTHAGMLVVVVVLLEISMNHA
jgi:hypothetical protein